jgi:hypothetical protein
MLSQPCSLGVQLQAPRKRPCRNAEKGLEESADGHLNTESHDVFAVFMPIWEHIGFKARLILFSRFSGTLAVSAISEAVRYN